MSGSHNHVSGGAKHLNRLAWALGLVVVLLVVEVVFGFLTGSLALLSDAGHMATDALGLGMALAAIMAARKATGGDHRTFGLYRLEILAALANAVLLFAVATYVFVEAIRRIQDPVEVVSGTMAIVALAGLVVNVTAWRLLRDGAQESLNLKGAYLEVMADLIGSVGVLAAAIAIRITGWTPIDPLVAAAIGIFILPRAWQLGKEALAVLLQAAPSNINVEDVHRSLAEIDTVLDVHDIHVWTLTSEMPVASAHLTTTASADPHPVLDAARQVLEDEYGITHATFQVEPNTHEGCTKVTW